MYAHGKRCRNILFLGGAVSFLAAEGGRFIVFIIAVLMPRHAMCAVD
jgi:prepilin-type processing-associated H-X9-DG protein